MNQLIVRPLECTHYETTWEAMKQFTATRTTETQDEWWPIEHFPVFTQGQAGKAEHLLEPGNIPVIQSDRGGQVTYHGPGQLVLYLLMDLKRHHLSVRDVVCGIERAIIALLKDYSIIAKGNPKAPGVYVNDAKIAALGLRIRRGCTYHGLSLNVNMDLLPFTKINPCGYTNLKVVQMSDFGVSKTPSNILPHLLSHLKPSLGF